MALKPVGARLVLENQRGFLSGFNKANKAVSSFGDNAKGVSAKTIALGNIMADLATGGLRLVARGFADVTKAAAGFVGDSIGMAADLQAQMSGVNAVLGASSDEMGQLRDLVTDLGLDPNLKVTAFEAADAIEILAKNGLSVSEILDGAARSTVALANATGADFSTAADIATDAMSQFNIGAADMGKAIDGITGVVNNSKFDIQDYRFAIAQSGEIAAQTGLSFEDFNTILAATASSFARGGDAGTSLKTALQRLSAPTDAVQSAMDQLGVSLFDAQGATRPMVDVVGDLVSGFSRLTQEEKSRLAVQLGGADASRTFLALSKMTREEFIALSAKVNQSGQAFENAQKRQDNYKGAMDILGGVIETVRLAIGDKLLPGLTDLARGLTRIVEQNAQPVIDFFGRAGEALSVLVSGLLAGKEPIATFSEALLTFGVDPGIVESFNNLVTSIRNVVIVVKRFVSEHAEALKGVLAGIGGVLASAGIAAALSAIGTVIGALLSPVGLLVVAVGTLGAAWANNWGGIRETVTDAWSAIQPMIVTGIETVKNWWSENSDEILRVASTIWGAIKALFSDTWQTITSLFETFRKLFRGDWEGFGQQLATTWRLHWTAITNFIGTIWDLVKPLLATFYGSAVQWFGEQDWKANAVIVLDAITNALKGFWTIAKPVLQGWLTSISEWFSSIDWKAEGLKVVNFVITGLKTIWSVTEPVLVEWSDRIDTFIAETDWENLGERAGAAVARGLKSIWTFITVTLPQFWEDVKAWFTAGAKWEDVGKIASDSLVDGFDGLIDAAKELASGFLKGFKKELGISSPSRLFIEVGEDTGEGYAIGLRNSRGAIDNAARGLVGSIESILSAGRGVGNIGAFFDRVSDKTTQFDSEMASLTRTIDELAAIEDPWANVEGGMVSFGGDIAAADRFQQAAQDYMEAQFEINRLTEERAGLEAQAQAVLERRAGITTAFEEARDQQRFLESQLELVDQLASQGIDIRGLGVDLGAGADPEQLLIAQTAALGALNEQLDLRLNNVGDHLAMLEEETRLMETQAALESERSRLKFLQDQQKLVTDIGEQGFDQAAILQGFRVGVEADQGEFLQVLTRFTQAMIGQVETDLGIASASTVFANIGRQITAGLAQGVTATSGMAASAVQGLTQRMIRPPASTQTTVNNRNSQNNITVNAGSGIDLAMIEAMVNRVVANAI